ncbi:MAG: hypothetical protein ACI4PV_08465 [Butyricicoccus sp.]
MSEHIVKLIPYLHTYRTNVKNAEAAVEVLKKLVEADEITFRQSEQPEFSDCGENLTEIRCPRCGALLPMDWWSEKMDEMHAADHFFILEQDMPCCGKSVSFNNLRYEAPCGFSCLEFTIRNPRNEVGKEVIDNLSERFGLLFRKVESYL